MKNHNKENCHCTKESKITSNKDSSVNYSDNGTQTNHCTYAPDTMRGDADKAKNKVGYDIESRTPNKFADDPMLQNNIVNAEFDYTKEETNSYLDSHKTKENNTRNTIHTTTKEKRSNHYSNSVGSPTVPNDSYLEEKLTNSVSECYKRSKAYKHNNDFK